ncbi:hypothetical protein Vpro01_03212 [Vibrio proteolyticus]
MVEQPAVNRMNKMHQYDQYSFYLRFRDKVLTRS